MAPANKLYYDFDAAAFEAIAEKAQVISDPGITYDTKAITAMLCFLEHIFFWMHCYRQNGSIHEKNTCH